MSTKTIDAIVKNYAPDMDAITITIGDWKIIVEKDYFADIKVSVLDTLEGSKAIYTLGEQGETHKL